MKKRRIFPLILLLSLVMSMSAPAALALEVPQLNGQAAVLVDLDHSYEEYVGIQDSMEFDVLTRSIR